MKKFLKNFGKAIGIGALIGLTLGILGVVFDWSDEAWMMAEAVVIGIVVIAVIINFAYMLYYSKKNREAIKLLEAQKPEEYLQVMEKYERQVKNKSLKRLFRLNMSAGYCDLKQYHSAKTILEELADEKMYGSLEMARCLNLCECYFYLGETEKALDLYEGNKKLFDRFRKNPAYDQNLMLLDILMAYAQDKTTELRPMLETVREKCTSVRLKKSIDDIDNLLKEKGV